VLGKFDEAEDDQTGGEWSQPNPSANWLLRAQADLTPAIIAKAIAQAAQEALAAWTPTPRRASTRAFC